MAASLNDVTAWIKDIFYRLRKLESGSWLENSSITSGRMRFIGGTLRVDSGGRVEIVGTLQVDGTSTVTGQFTVTGPWSLQGDGTITGRVTISGPVQITGNVDLTGVMTVTGEIRVSGSGRVRIGDMVLDPSVAGGALIYGNGSRLEADGSINGARLIAGDAIVNVGAVSSIRKGPSSVIVSSNSVTVNAAGGGDIDLIGSVHVPGIPTLGGTGLPLNTLLVTGSGYLRRSDGT
ncbi:hypothetical protein M3D75_02790 [Microbacterium enclense]|uniref:hypothetical protein n=1 Tax=Microbacterium enclense TaxID=993073 RepID=UPI0021A8AC12|nr:hypothetical protein [Microbacterium enclense]MCT2085034.1 hypothetical protein [Microbacterium enclense]